MKVVATFSAQRLAARFAAPVCARLNLPIGKCKGEQKSEPYDLLQAF